MENTELKSVIETLNGKIDSFRSEVESVKGSDVVTETKLKKMEADLAETLAQKSAIENRLSAIEAASNRPGATKGAEVVNEAKAAFLEYVRDSGSESKKAAFENAAKSAFEAKAVDTVTGENGGFAVDSEIARQVVDVARNYSPIRRLSRVDVVSTPDYSVIVNLGGANYKWVGQLETDRATTEPKLATVVPAMGTVVAEIQATRTSIQDMFYNVENWIVTEIAEAFAQAEGSSFLTGTGVGTPRGLLHGNALPTVNTGVANGLGVDPFETMIKTFYDLDGSYRQNATWLLNSATMAKLVTAKDTNGNYLFPQTLQANVDAHVLGRPVAIDEGMPAIAANSTPIVLADFKKAFLIADRSSFWFQANPYKVSGRVVFEAEKRVGSNILIADAARALKIAV